ncbi:MAG: DUF1385 domain-containing protein [Oscillospiraceae bacterium]|nr:DUF1385 domain-containing protein [Oscillospiraceae bacterium]
MTTENASTEKKEKQSKRSEKKDKTFRTMIGGQAIIEGIMMRGPDRIAMVVRAPDGIVAQEKEFVPYKDKNPVLGWPFVRGVIGFVDSMRLGMKALMWSAEYYPEEEQPDETPAKEPSRFARWLDKKLESEAAQKAVITLSMVLGVVLAVGVFMLLPAFLTGLIGRDAVGGVWRNLLEGLVRLAILLGYLFLVSRMKDIQRVFSYHGAEHKTIACYEAGAELTTDNVRRYSRLHPRCGTSFLLTVVIISIFVFSVTVPFEDMWLRLASRLVLLPVVVAISYEANRLVGRYDNLFTRILRAPGLWMQRLTTNEPDDAMIEVGVEALRRVLPKHTGDDEWGKYN